ELGQGGGQEVLRLQGEGIGGLVKQQEIRRPQQHSRERVTIPFPARKHADALEHVIIGKKKGAQQRAQLGLIANGRWRKARQIVDQARVRIEDFILVLLEIIEF